MRSELASVKTLGAAAALVLASALLAAAQNPAQLQGKTTDQAFKNIQVLKGLPADQLIPTMRFIRDSLGGVACEFCHLEDRSADDKPEKQTARKMMAMELEINKDRFDGRVAVTCYTCHRGATMPVGTPVIPDQTAAAAAPQNEQAAEEPSIDQILAKYVTALGGESALRKVTSRVMTGTVDLPAAAGNPAAHVQMESDAKAPNFSLLVLTGDKGATSNGFDGTVAWAQDARGRVTTPMGTDLDRAKRAADFYEPLDVKQEYERFLVRGPQKIGTHDAYRVVAFPKGDSVVQLFFDTQSGLLLRRIDLIVTPLGNDPVYTDYDDYRDAGDGVKVPFLVQSYVWTQRTVTHVQKVQDNVPIDDAKFNKPESKARGAAGQ